MIGIAGLARAGKDTLAKELKEVIKEDLGLHANIISFAFDLRSQIDGMLKEFYGISAFTEDPEEKKIIRPLLVAHGEQMKKKFGKDIWLKSIMTDIEELIDNNIFPIIPDVRFDFEVEGLQNKGAGVIHISKTGNQPPNEIEALNDPIISELCDVRHCWPEHEPDQMHLCKDHAHILWQILKSSHEEKWTKIYS